MPQRPRPHQVETLGMRAFERAVPAAWTVDVPAQGHDYGVDASVELFDEDGQPYPSGFYVQVKATDGSELSAALSVETWRHYLRLDRPVLIVRYLAGTDALYVLWAHQAVNRPPAPDQQTVTVRWTPADLWGQETPDQLVTDVIRFRDAKEAGRARPLAAHVAVLPSGRLTLQAGRMLRRALKTNARGLEGLVNLITGPGRPPSVLVRVDVDEHGVAVDFGGVTKTRTDLPSELETAEAAARLASTVLALVGTTASWAGHDVLAGDLLAHALPKASIRDTPSFASEAARALALGGRPRALDDYVGYLVDTARLHPEAVHTATVVVLALRGLPHHAVRLDALDRYMEGLTDAVLSHEDPGSSAAALYTLANHYRAGPVEADRSRQALALFNGARKLDPTYSSRAYFASEVAATLFDLKRPLASAAWYRLTVELGDDEPFTAARWADALIDVGRFAEAAEQVASYATAGDALSERPYWWVRHQFARHAAETFGSSVRRDPSGSHGIPETDGDADLSARLAVSEARLALDPLNPSAWFNAALSLHILGRGLEAARAFAFAACCQYGDGEAWANAFVGYLTSGGPAAIDWTVAVGCAGLRSAGDQFEDTVADFVEAQDDPDTYAFVLDLVDVLKGTLPLEKQGDLTIRVDGVDILDLLSAST